MINKMDYSDIEIDKLEQQFNDTIRTISCCNVVYKCITKILANQLRGGLNDIVSSNQSACIPGRSIAENILLAQEIVSDYHKNNGKPRSALKIDLMKAYDSMSWDFIVHCLKCFGAPQQFVHWIQVCLTSPQFCIALNGSLVGYYSGKKGLRQGNPISPYLFVLAMEVLSLLLAEAVGRFPRFGFHPRCQALGRTHLCFADDLLIFSVANSTSIKVILDVLKEFEELSGLKANPHKSSFFCSSISAETKLGLLNLLQLAEDKLPVRYLGVLLITFRHSTVDCESLVAKFTSRIDSWCSKHLSFVGRVQLISSVWFSIQVF
jgi:hypothetical protein